MARPDGAYSLAAPWSGGKVAAPMHVRIAPDLDAELVLPPGQAAAPGVIVLHEWWGLNDEIRALCGRLAVEGFVALGLDLYRGRSTSDPSRARELSDELQTSASMRDVDQAVGYLKAHPRCSGTVGITGFCLGGALSLAAACNVGGLSAAVPFYGLPRAEHADWSRVAIPIQMHFGRRDPIVTVARAEAARDALEAAGKDVALHLYDAGHAFMRQSDPSAYDEAAAKAAWERMLSFLRSSLS